jgi:glycosyltransferase involved in cell wall biosynthesis
MKVLHVPHAYWPFPGGAEVLAAAVSESLVARGHEVHVFTANVPGSSGYGDLGMPPVDAPAREERRGVHIERFPFLRISQKTWDRLYSWPIPFRSLIRRRLRRQSRVGFRSAVAKAVQRHRPDAVLAMAHYYPSAVAVAEARKRSVFPMVYAPQLHHDQPGWREEVVRDVVSVSDAIAANTNYEAGLLSGEYGADPAAIVVTGCGVHDTAGLAPWPRRRRVLYLGRKVSYKGIGLLIDAMRLIWAEDPAVELVLAGARVRETMEIDAVLARLPREERERVRDLDNVSEDVKEELLRTSTCLVLPSRHESFGIVLLEAWRHGTPIVTLDHPVARDVVREGETGLLAPLDDASGLAAEIRKLLRDEALAERMGRAGHADVAARHTWAHVAERYEQALEIARDRVRR